MGFKPNPLGFGGFSVVPAGFTVLSGATDPSSGLGVAAQLGQLYTNTSDNSLWQKIGAGDTAWQLIDSSGYSKYISPAFNNTTDWTPNATNYEITYTAVAHGKGTNASIEVWEDVGGSYENVNVVIVRNASGDITIQVGNGSRFSGIVEIF